MGNQATQPESQPKAPQSVRSILKRSYIRLLIPVIGIPLVVFFLSIVISQTVNKIEAPTKAAYTETGPGSCLVLPEKYCKSGKVVEIDGQFMGLGFDLPADTPIYADKDGTLTSSDFEIRGGKYPSSSITKDSITSNFIFYPAYSKPIEADTYDLSGNQIADTSTRGEKIGALTAKKMSVIGEYNLIILVNTSSEESDNPDKQKTLDLMKL